MESILSTALHANAATLKMANISFSDAHYMLEVEEICQYDWQTIPLINSYIWNRRLHFARK